MAEKKIFASKIRAGAAHAGNPILVDVRIYRAGRQQMNNPKGWAHVLRKFEQAVATTYPWADATAGHVTHARKVLTRLTALEATHG